MLVMILNGERMGAEHQFLRTAKGELGGEA
jgi:hypothetical protein